MFIIKRYQCRKYTAKFIELAMCYPFLPHIIVLMIVAKYDYDIYISCSEDG